MPVLHKIKGKETIESVLIKLENDVLQRVQREIVALDLDSLPNEIILVGLKEEQTLQVYAKTKVGYKLFKSYPFTAYSGQIGPKLRKGDKQIPEGIYYIEYLNPNSSYYLSMKISYPNDFDKIKTKLIEDSELGNDIFIHGESTSIGCIAIGNEAIEEVFILASKSFKNKIKVIISPRDFRRNQLEPEIDDIDWEGELYTNIKQELFNLDSINLNHLKTVFKSNFIQVD